MAPVSVRYIVDDVGAAMDFYTSHLGFTVELNPAPGFALLSRGDLQLLLNAPGAGGAGHASDAGDVPAPGGWSRFQLQVDDLDGVIAGLREASVSVRTGAVGGAGGRQAVIEDPAGNPIELFEPPAG